MKLITSDALSILRRYNKADTSDVPRMIDRLEVTNPISTNTLAHFKFEKQQYVIVFDDTAGDDTDYLLEQIHITLPNIKGSFVANPTADDTYGAPYKGKDCYLFHVDAQNKRLDVYLAEQHPDTSRSIWQKHIKAGRIRVNGTVQTTTKFAVTPTDTVVASLPDKPDFSDQTLPIIYQDDNVIVVDKPAGVLTHRKSELDDEFTVAEFFRNFTTVGLDGDRPGIVHRLDRDTSGLIIGARTQAAFDSLKAQFSERTVGKVYYAITDGVPKQTDMLIDVPIGRDSAHPGTFKASYQGKEAQTSLHIESASDKHALVRLTPRTGRTHQLRVHLEYIYTPIHGDRLYGKAGDRMYLHASELAVTLPNGDKKRFESPLPQIFNTIATTSNG